MRCEDKCRLATMRCVDCGTCSAHAFFAPESTGACSVCMAKRVIREQEKRMSKTLSPPEAVTALLDGKTLAFSGNLFRYQDGCFASRPQNNPAGPPWRDVAWRAADLLEAFINSPPWSVVPETYDWTEARKRMAAGKTVRRCDSKAACCLRLGAYVFASNPEQAYTFGPGSFEGDCWEDA